MRFLASASSSSAMSSGTPGSKVCTTTSSRWSDGITCTACWASTRACGRTSCTTQAGSNVAARAASVRRMPNALRCMSASSLRVLLVVDVFLPELVLQLRIRLRLGGLAQPPGDDVVVVAGRDLARRHAAAAAAAGSAATDPDAAALSRGGRVARNTAVTAGRALGAQVTGAVACQRAVTVAAVTVERVLAAAAGGRPTRSARIALLRGAFLFLAQRVVELPQRGIEPAIDRRTAFARRGRTGRFGHGTAGTARAA